MTDRPLVVLPFRAVVLALLGVFLVGAAGGALGTWLTARRVLRVTPDGSRVVERIERVETTAESALAEAAAAAARSTVAVIDERGRVLQQALALTADGVLLSAGPVPRGILRVLGPGRARVPASVVRVYPEFGVWILRATGTFPLPPVEREAGPLPGVPLAAVAGPTDSAGPRVNVVPLEVYRLNRTRAHATYQGLARLPVLSGGLPASFQGAPLLSADGRVQGLALIERDGTSLLPGSVLDVLLQDYLQHPESTEVRSLSGLRGEWRAAGDDADGALVFHVSAAPGGSALGGIQARDEISALGREELQGAAPLASAFLGAARAGSVLSLSVRRAGEDQAVEVRPVIR